jgi:glutamine amidotransferase
MCRILAIKNFDYKTHEQVLLSFFGLSRTGKVPENNTPGHTDGWGIGYYKNNKPILIKSGNSIIDEQKKFFTALKQINKTQNLIVHLRKSAWTGTNTKQNAHPFKSKNIILCHNGTIWDYDTLPGTSVMDGTRKKYDSEVYLDFIMSNYTGDIKPAFEKSVAYIKKHNKHSSLTCVFSDGKKLFVYRECMKNREWYYTLYKTQLTEGSTLVCSEPIGSNLDWTLLKNNSLISF